MFENVKAQRAYSLHARGRLEEARRLYEELFAQGYDHARYYASYSMLLLGLQEFETARDVIVEALDYFESLPPPKPKPSRPDEPVMDKRNRQRDRMNLRLNLALALWKTGDIDGAVATARSVFGSYKNATVFGTLGFLLIAQGDITGDYTQAEALNLEALEYDQEIYAGKRVHPNIIRESAVILDNVGQVYYRLGDKEKAKGYFTKAHERRDSQVDTLYYLARIAWDEGDGSAARKWIEKLYDRPSFPILATVPKEKMDALRDEIMEKA